MNSCYLAALKYIRRSQSLTPGIQTSSSCWVTVSPSGEGTGCKSGSLACKTGMIKSQSGPLQSCLRQALGADAAAGQILLDCQAVSNKQNPASLTPACSTFQDYFTTEDFTMDCLISTEGAANGVKVKPGPVRLREGNRNGRVCTKKVKQKLSREITAP